MTRDVVISIKGLYTVKDEEGNIDDSVEIFNPGKYCFRNGKHYAEYEEPADDDSSSKAGRTRITLRGHHLEVTRQGAVNTKMIFEEGVKNNCWYDTAAGSMFIGVDVKKMQVTESEELIEIFVDYALEANYEHLTDNSICIRIMAKDSGLLHLM
ncbi:MAG: DUF1934 domain-containing protein [Clostridiales bacterium]|nr:DUF1934 domain-containing protein [Clostridiales bacterium]